MQRIALAPLHFTFRDKSRPCPCSARPRTAAASRRSARPIPDFSVLRSARTWPYFTLPVPSLALPSLLSLTKLSLDNASRCRAVAEPYNADAPQVLALPSQRWAAHGMALRGLRLAPPSPRRARRDRTGPCLCLTEHCQAGAVRDAAQPMLGCAVCRVAMARLH